MREDTMLSLKWQSFPSQLAVSLDTCYEKQQFVDLSLVCKDGTVLKCHKMVLANSSPFFRRLLVANEHPHPMIILHDIEADDLKTIVNFMYCGEIQVVQSEVRRLLRLAEILEVNGLRHIQTSVLVGETVTATGNNNNGNTVGETRTKTVASRLKLEEARILSKAAPDLTNRTQAKPVCPQVRLPQPGPPRKPSPKPAPEPSRRPEEPIGCPRLETGRPAVHVLDIHDVPSTSRGVTANPHKRKEPSGPEPVITWPRILSALSKDKPLPLKKLCIMDEVEITAGRPSRLGQARDKNEPLDRRKGSKSDDDNDTDRTMKCEVYIKDELDIPSELEEDADMDPLEVEEVENESSDNVTAPSNMFTYPNIDHGLYSASAMSEFPSRKGSGETERQERSDRWF